MFRKIYFAEYKVRSTFYIACRTNGSLPLRGGRWRRRRRMRAGVYALLILCRIVRKKSRRRLPLGGKKTASSLSRKRLMRGGSICTCKRHTLHMHPTHKTSATAALSKKTPPARNKKLPPRAPVPYKAKQLFAMYRRVLLGEVLGERGRFGGREPRLSRGGSLPPRSSFPINKSSCKRGGIGGRRGCCQCP